MSLPFSPELLRRSLSELYDARLLAGILLRREWTSQYGATRMRWLWLILRPLAFVSVYVFFAHLLRFGGEAGFLSFSLWVLSGMGAWQYFADLVTNAGNVLHAEAHLIRKNAFPPGILLIYKSLPGLTDLGATLLIMFVPMVVTGQTPSWPLVFLPVAVLLTWMAGITVALWVNLLGLRFRDSFYVAGMAIQIGFWLTPVIWNPASVAHIWQPLLWGNPMSGIIALYRWSLGIAPGIAAEYSLGILLMVLFFVAGWIRFFQRQGTLADFL